MTTCNAAPILCAQALQKEPGNLFRWFAPLPAWLAKDLLHQMCSLRLLGVPFKVPHFFVFFLCLFSLSTLSVAADAVVLRVGESSFRVAHEGLIEAIESEGLVVGTILPFREMLIRTAQSDEPIPYGEAEIVQFCSGALAAELVREAPEQLTLCPMSIALYTLAGESSAIQLVYRVPGATTAGRRRAESLLQRIVQRAAELARLK